MLFNLYVLFLYVDFYNLSFFLYVKITYVLFNLYVLFLYVDFYNY